MEALYHIGFDDTHGAKYAILPGDPGRVDKIAAYLENPRFYITRTASIPLGWGRSKDSRCW